MKTYTYKDSGVDVGKADRLIDKLKSQIQGTFNPFVLNPIGGFAALTEIPDGFKKPVLVSSTDGVGTKLKIAFKSNKHDTVGIDLVAMSANDILTLGAKPYFFLDYYACGGIDEAIYSEVIKGICEGCRQAGCALIGGETAEMPSFYSQGEYDLAGFIIGFVEKDRIIDGSKIKEGDAVIAMKSSGLHSNGFSLVRKVLFDVHKMDIDSKIDGIEGEIYRELLKPTRIYVRPVHALLERYSIKGMAHITGGGLPGNIKRIIPDGLAAHIELKQNMIPEIFRVTMRLGNVPVEDMYSTFNMGIGYVVIVDGDDATDATDFLNQTGEDAFIAGMIKKSSNDQKVMVTLI